MGISVSTTKSKDFMVMVYALYVKTLGKDVTLTKDQKRAKKLTKDNQIILRGKLLHDFGLTASGVQYRIS